MSSRDLDRYLTDERVERACRVLVDEGADSEDGSWHSWRCFDKERYPGPCDCTAEIARAALADVLPGIIRQAKAEGEPLPVVNHKGPYDTDASIFRTMAEKLRRDEPVGGSNACDALARLIDREVARADRIEQGGRP